MGGSVKDQLGRVQSGIETCPAVILVNPQLGENIGAAARAMLNFGLTDLRLVAPRDGWPNPASEATAAGATEVLENAKVFETTADAVSDLSFLLAVSRVHPTTSSAMICSTSIEKTLSGGQMASTIRRTGHPGSEEERGKATPIGILRLTI